MFLEEFFTYFQRSPSTIVLREVQGENIKNNTCADLLNLIQQAQQRIKTLGVKKGDRVALVGSNSVQWIACDLAILSMGAITVPLYHRQNPKELAFMIQDSEPKLLIYSTIELKKNIYAYDVKTLSTSFSDLFSFPSTTTFNLLTTLSLKDIATIIYTSGTSANPKGALLTFGNIDFILTRTSSQLELATREFSPMISEHRVFHFLPLCFAGSRMMFWTQLLRQNPVYLSTDLKNLVQEMTTAAPHFYLNVPAVLERIKNGVEQKINENFVLRSIYNKAVQTQDRKNIFQKCAFGVLSKTLLQSIRKKIGPNIQFLICGSAALQTNVQKFFQMIGIPILQVYGLTETTAIITMDDPKEIEVGMVGKPIDDVETKISDDGELLCKGPNVFQGYWNLPQETSKSFDKEGWFRTGDLAEINDNGNVRILGRTKNLIIPTSGHNIVPEPIEEQLQKYCKDIEHAVLVGHGKPFLSVIVTGNVSDPEIARAIENVNHDVPHYRKIKTYLHYKEGFTIDNGFLTANQKVKRKAIETWLHRDIERLYETPL